ncbi:hypothetical protein CXB51_000262 [Gossypium anomalum]|uniref:RRM domain-containing protein n=1 Tax=Gossypium anomalum TaxID=47600 RepID=A0A8J6D893_9ROSI|nr:hypothetical protein CXB51_000262 [Gossypium anomalum]
MPVESQVTRYQEDTESFTKQNREANLSVDSCTVGAERVSNQSVKLLKPVNQGLGTTLSFGGENGFHSDEGNKVNTVTSLSENSLFSSSFSEFFTRKLRLSSNNALYGNSIDTVASDYEEEEPFESLEELEAQTIGNLLPDDDDLFSGVTEGLDSIVQPNRTEDAEELDVFSSIGGMDLGDDGPGAQKNYNFPEKSRPGLLNGSVAGEHPSRTLFVRNINSNVEDSELKAVFELYGEIHVLDSACKHHGFVMISYFDIRAAEKAIEALQDRPLRSRKLDIHYSIPKDNPLENEENQGTLVVFNLNSTVSNDEIRRIFGAYGEIKEIYETPKKSQHKFIEFYDVRASEAALHALNKTEISGNLVEILLSHPESLRRYSVQQVPSAGKDECYPYEDPYSPSNDANLAFSGILVTVVGANSSNNMDIGTSSGLNSAIKAPFLEPTVHHGISSGVSNSLTSMVRAGSTGNQSVIAESDHLQMKFDIQGAPAFYPRSLPEYQNGLSRAIHSSSKPLEIIDNKSFSLVSSTGHSFEYLNAGFPSAGNRSHLLPGRHCSWSNSYHPEPPSMMWPNSPSMVNGIYAARPSAQLHGLPTAHTLNTGVPVINYHVGSAPTVNPSLWDPRHAYGGESPKASSFHPGSLGSMRGSSNFPHSTELKSRLQLLHSRSPVYNGRGNIFPITKSAGSPHEHARSRRNEGSINGADKKQYELDIERIIRGEDKRTTLMLKNIPNKCVAPDFDSLRYNMVSLIILILTVNYNCSEKVASLAYARIQGKAALIAHFQNSSLMNEDKRCRPILFNTDGPNVGDQVPFPVGVNVRTKPGKAARSSNNEENNQESPSNSENEANSSN